MDGALLIVNYRLVYGLVMNHEDHVELIAAGIDAGSGRHSSSDAARLASLRPSGPPPSTRGSLPRPGGDSPSGAPRHLPPPGGVWADLGAGTGAFTLALRDLAGPEIEIYAVDRDASSLRSLQAAFDRHFPGSNLHLQTEDFTRPLDLPPLDGILAANAIHFVRDHVSLLRQWRDYLKPDGRLVLVEYDTDDGNRWVPYPVSFEKLATVARAAGFSEPNLVGMRGSRFLDRMYAAVMFSERFQSPGQR